jgi:hypothetical protein
LCAHCLVFLGGELERLGAGGVAAFADEQLVVGLGEQTGQARDVLVHLAKQGLAARELVP